MRSLYWVSAVLAACLLASSVFAQSQYQAGKVVTDVAITPVNVALTNGTGYYVADFWLRPFDNDDRIERITVIPADASSASVLTRSNSTWATSPRGDPFNYTLFNITTEFFFEYLPGYATWRFRIETVLNVYESDVNLLPFNVFGFAILQPGTDPNSPGSPSNNKIVSGALHSWTPGNWAAVLLQPERKWVFPVKGHFTTSITRFPYDQLLASVRPYTGTVYLEQTDWDPAACTLTYLDYVGDEYNLTEGCGFAFFIKANAIDDVFVMQLNPYRTLDWVIDFKTNELIEVDGESFETILHSSIGNNPLPPTVVDGSYSYVLNYYGWQIFPFAMYNLFSPPRPVTDPMTGGFMTVLNPPNPGTVYDINLSYTDTTPAATYTVFVQNIAGVPSGVTLDQLLDFTMTSQYKVSGNRNMVFLGDSTVKYSNSTLCQPQQINNSDITQNVVEFAVDFLRYAPNNVSQFTCDLLMNVIRARFPQFTSLEVSSVGSINAQRFSANGVSRAASQEDTPHGQSTVTVRGQVPAQDAQSTATQVDQYTSSKEFADAMYMDPAWVKTGTPATVQTASQNPTQSSGPGGGAQSGFPTWAIAVISVIAGLLLILIIAIGLFLLLARGEDEDTESSYSSEGPALVPRPDDVMYQQAIVRDEYGRGEWTDNLEGAEMENGIRAEYPRIVA